MGLFSYNSSFNQKVNQVLDCIFLSILWILFSLPVITVGAATVALYHSVHKVIRREEGRIWLEFWRAFRRDFKRATLLWLLMLLICGVLVGDCYLAFFFPWSHTGLQVFMQIAAVFLTALCAIWLQFWLPYLARFDDRVGRILKNTLFMMTARTKTSFHLLLLFLLVVTMDVIISLYAPVLALFMPVAYIISLNRILERLFGEYIALSNECVQ